jgi:hypothetical protein
VLSQSGEYANFDLVLGFAAAVPPDTVSAVLERAGVTATPRPRGKTSYVVSSPSLKSKIEGGPRTTTSNGNFRLHRWFREQAFPALVALHRDAGLTSVTVEL